VKRFAKSFWQLIVGALCIFGGAAAIYLGWYGAAHTRDVTDQIPYVVSGGLLGAALIVLGGSFYFSFYVARLHAATRRQAAALERVSERLDALAMLAAAREERPNGSVLVVAGGRRYHRPGCTLVAGKDTTTLGVADAQDRGLEPCKVCEPAGSTN
jgi:hypothetical protein